MVSVHSCKKHNLFSYIEIQNLTYYKKECGSWRLQVLVLSIAEDHNNIMGLALLFS